MKFYIGTMDNSIPARCCNWDILDATGIDCSKPITQDQENDALGFAAELAVQLYGNNADAFYK